MDMDFPQNTADLACALRRGDIAAAEFALDMMAREGERPNDTLIAKGRARARALAARSAPLAA